MKRFWFAAGPSLALCACSLGGGEDFTVQVSRSPAEVMAVLRDVQIDDAGIFMSGLKLKVTRPQEGELLFSMPTSEFSGHKGEESRILIRFEPVRDGKGTVLHVAVDVPPVPVMMGKPNMVLSEAKVEKELKKVLSAIAKSLSEGKSIGPDRHGLGQLLFAVAVSSDAGLQAQANELKKDPSRLEGLIEDSVADAPEPEDALAREDHASQESESDSQDVGVSADNDASQSDFEPSEVEEPAFE